MNRQQMMMVEEDPIFKPFHNIQLIFFFTSPCLLQFNCNNAVCQYWFCTIPACHIKEIFAQNNQNTCSDSKLQSNTCCRRDWETVAVWPKCQLQNILFSSTRHLSHLSSVIENHRSSALHLEHWSTQMPINSGRKRAQELDFCSTTVTSHHQKEHFESID